MWRAELSDYVFTRSFVYLEKTRKIKSGSLRRVLVQIASSVGMANNCRPIIRAKLELSQPPSAPCFGTVSFVVGDVIKTPTFACGNLNERVLAYVLFLEFGEYSAVQLRNVPVAELEPLLNYSDFASHAQITSVLSDSANILKIAARIINPAQNGLTGRAYEGTSLQNEMPQFGSGKTIPRSLKANDSGETISVTAGASRITSYGQAVKLNIVGSWFHRMCTRLQQSRQSRFVSRFAKPVIFEREIQQLTSQLIVFDTIGIRTRLSEDGLTVVKRFRKTNARQYSFAKITDSMLDHQLHLLGNNQIVLENKFELGALSRGRKKLKVDLPSLKAYALTDGTKHNSLVAYINSKDLFSVYFDSTEYVQLGGSLFRDGGLIAEIEGVISALSPVAAMGSADREKVDISRDRPHPTKATLSNFPSTSVFDIVESNYGGADYIFCDDLGDEWADHIIVDRGRQTLTFVHSKHGKPSRGASSLHEVVGQALKNMGNLLCMPSSMRQKLAGFDGTFMKGTQISRVRAAPLGETFETTLDRVEQHLSSNKLQRQMVLACSFLSATDCTNDLNALRSGGAVRASVRQLLWLLSYFVSACKEVNVEPIIHCRR
ncbi:hypothetical protein GTP38_19785 [Duganella sp. FT94W]|uniref:Uncharacterized protein n=1 Tax=Duganella lactea TaxID=2692173 RepID=A0ABW9VAA0_9BURK|nr:hypothetical protein [Duganella lactea]MYM36574.1 hypothetical protein [Duganella lactea]